MKRTVYNEDHEAFRETIRDFIAKEVVPVYDEWEEAGHPPRDLYRKLGELGVMGFDIPEEYGGAGETSFKYQAVITEEAARAGVSFGQLQRVTPASCCPTCSTAPTRSRSERWLPGFASGDIMLRDRDDRAGHRLRPGRHHAPPRSCRGRRPLRPQRRQDLHHRRRRTPTCASWWPGPRRRPGRTAAPACRCSWSTPTATGFAVGRKLDKIGLQQQRHRRAVLHRRPGAGGEPARRGGQGVRLPGAQPAAGAAGHRVDRRTPRAAAAIDFADRLRQGAQGLRQAGGRRSRTPSSCWPSAPTEVEAAQAHGRPGASSSTTPASSPPPTPPRRKLFCTEVAGRVIDKCLQLHGGYGYILEYPIARLYADTRVTRIYGGTSEVMKTIIAKSMGL